MSFRTLLVQTEDSTPGRTQVKAAVNLAQRFNASLTGVYLKAEQIPAMFIGDAFSAVTLVESFFQEREELISGASARAKAMFETAAMEAGIRYSWSEVNGDSEAALTHVARRHDLTILRREVQPVGGAGPILASEVAMGSGAPVLILPEAGYKIPFGQHVLVGWKEGREAARALHDAMPFLRTATRVTMFSVSQDAPEALDDFGKAFFSEHGIGPVNVAIDRDEDQSAGDAIRRRSGIVGADLLVLGLYGHSRMQELFLGGVSRNMLSDLNLPMLVSH